MRGRLQQLSRVERWAVYLWVATASWTAPAFALPGLTMVAIFLLAIIVIGLPLAFVLVEAPSLFMYLTAFAPIYLLLRRHSLRRKSR